MSRHRIPEVGARIMDLQAPGQKMSTTAPSEQGTIYLLDDERAILKKVKSAVTDSGTEVRRGPDKAGVSNLIEVLAAVRGAAPGDVERDLEGAGYGQLKQAVGEAVRDYLAPVRERYWAIRPDEAAIEAALAAGAERARAIASETLADVRGRMGVGAPE
jgi:tryptophanyl-tRNA synthetase